MYACCTTAAQKPVNKRYDFSDLGCLPPGRWSPSIIIISRLCQTLQLTGGCVASSLGEVVRGHGSMTDTVGQQPDSGTDQQKSTAPSGANETGATAATVPDSALLALKRDRASVKEARASLSKEFGTVTRDILAALRKASEGALQKESAARIAESMQRQEPQVERVENGLISRVAYPDRTSRQFAYSADGSIEKLTDKDGSVWKLEAGKWVQFGADGSPSGQTFEGKIVVDQAGTYCYEDPADGSRVYERPDGSKLVEDQSGLRMEADAAEKLTLIQYADGTCRRFQYDAEGRLNRLIDKDSSTWKTSDGLRWFQYGVDGLKTGDVWFGKITVDSSGAYAKENGANKERVIEEPYGATITESSDGNKLIQNPDGTVLIEKPDGSRFYTTADGTHISETPTGYKALKPYGAEIEVDENRRITKITYPDRTVRIFKYEAAGSLIEISDRDGSVWKQGTGGGWLQHILSGEATGQTRAGTMMVDDHGNCIYHDSENAVSWIDQPDGLRVTEAADGARFETSADGRSATYVAASSRRFAVITSGFLRYETQEGDSLKEIAFDAVRYRHFFEVGYTPTDEEVATERRRLSRITSIQDVRGVPPGKIILIKARVETITPEVLREVRQITESLRAAEAESVAPSSAGDPADEGQHAPSSSSQSKGPKDTAEAMLPWFALDR